VLQDSINSKCIDKGIVDIEPVLQGMGVRITHKDIFTPAFGEAISKVLQDPKYRAAADLISRKLRARKRTPVQEAAGQWHACSLCVWMECT